MARAAVKDDFRVRKKRDRGRPKPQQRGRRSSPVRQHGSAAFLGYGATNAPPDQFMHASNCDLIALLDAVPATDLTELYARHDVEPHKGATALVKALCKDGGSTVANLCRRGGVSYLEVVRDVAEQLGVKGASASRDVAELEQRALDAAWQRFQAKATDKELQEIAELAAHARHRYASRAAAKAVTVAALRTAAIHVLIKLYGRRLVWMILWRVVLPRLGLMAALRTVPWLAGGALGPIGWAVAGAGVLYELDKPAMRKTLESVLQIANLRAGQESEQCAAAQEGASYA